ncbi:MAG: DEAD/DEAH box helicase [Pyrinomonadaceae bacterium]
MKPGAKHESQTSVDGNRGRPAPGGGGPALRRLLEGIGTPESAPFRADSFQIEALERIRGEDVLVTAPTGSGKTWIAREGIRRLLTEGRRAWYTSPLKALTNSKYHEFIAEFGREAVGILTGDRKENSDAPLIVGTTEIYRNQLFDALRGGREVRADLVVLDEAHYLADEERGHVWEEAIILSPPRVRLLLLSATVGNADELAAWIGEVRGGRCGVITRPGNRPVPLRAAFLYPNAALAPLLDKSGQLNPEIIQFIQNSAVRHPRFGGSEAHRRPQQKMNLPEMPPAMLLDTLGSSNLLPAIIFLPTRRRCDEAASEAASLKKNERPERREARRRVMQEFAAQHPEIRRHRHWDMVARSGVGSHHAGHIPIWKLVIERLMSEGLLDAIFATATVAAGVDFPARTVVFTGVEVRTGHGWRSLSASELQQMTGRAGRRGRDLVGFIVVAPGTHQNPQRVATLLKSPPDPLASQFRATYSTLLNLLDAYGSFDHVRDIVERSFAHRETAQQLAQLERELSHAAQLVTEKLAASGNPTLTIDMARGFERLASARTRLLEEVPQTQGEVMLNWLDREVVPGRVVRIGRNGKRHLFVTDRRGGNLIGLREDGRRAAIALDRVGRVYDSTYSLSDADLAFDDLHANRMTALGESRLAGERAPLEAATSLLNDLMDQVVRERARRRGERICDQRALVRDGGH